MQSNFNETAWWILHFHDSAVFFSKNNFKSTSCSYWIWLPLLQQLYPSPSPSHWGTYILMPSFLRIFFFIFNLHPKKKTQNPKNWYSEVKKLCTDLTSSIWAYLNHLKLLPITSIDSFLPLSKVIRYNLINY